MVLSNILLVIALIHMYLAELPVLLKIPPINTVDVKAIGNPEDIIASDKAEGNKTESIDIGDEYDAPNVMKLVLLE